LTLNRNHVEWLALVFFLALVGVVFQQINTDLVAQGIAEGDPFHNAAFYPRAVALLILGAVFIRAAILTTEIKNTKQIVPEKRVSEIFRPVQLVCLFGLYLYFLDILGYHLATAPFVALIMTICGDRKPLPTLLFSVSTAFLIAYVFEKYLKIVLPGGIFSINIPW
jgi:putative tricarboxylic transport membrane protein